MAGLFDAYDDADELSDADDLDSCARLIRDALEALPDRMEIHGRLFGRNGRNAFYTNIYDADDNRVFEIDLETGQLWQWPDCD